VTSATETVTRLPSTGVASSLAALAGRARWYRWLLRYPALRAQPPVRLGAGSLIDLSAGGSLSVGRGVVARPDLSISAAGDVRIGDNVFLGRGVIIACDVSVEIGADTRVAERVSIHDSDHLIEPLSDLAGRVGESLAAPVRIGSRVWLAANVVVLRGVTVGDDTVVGANSVVRSDLPPGVLAAGVPARVIRALKP
jgi:acetyltransferase-like isoleucine patch superfamily enzyme